MSNSFTSSHGQAGAVADFESSYRRFIRKYDDLLPIGLAAKAYYLTAQTKLTYHRIMRGKNTITLVLPYLLQAEEKCFSEVITHPKLKKIFNKAKVVTENIITEDVLLNIITNEKHLSVPIAALSALGNDLAAEDNYWLRIDPVELLVDAGNIYLVGKDHLNLENNETDLLLESLNSFLKAEDIFIQKGHHHEWFLELVQKPNITTYPLGQVISKDIRNYLPIGKDHKRWCLLLTELQMLLNNNPVNEQRRINAKPTINSVWIWGEGEILQSYSLEKWIKIWSDLSFVRGVVKKSNAQLCAPEAFSMADILTPGKYLLILSAEQHFLMPQLMTSLLTEVDKNKISKLNIYFGNGRKYSWQSGKIRRFFTFR